MIDAIDRQIILATQAGLPLVSEPYRAIADELGLDPAEVIARMERMLASGKIRRIGAVPNHYALGYKANGMSVWNVPDDMVDMLGERVGKLDFVSHCYRRPRHLPDWPYNLFAMLHGHDRDEVMRQVEVVAALQGEANLGHDVLFSKRILKKTGLRLNA
jgi:DNA-binding Lrp family transcriptional regulator